MKSHHSKFIDCYSARIKKILEQHPEFRDNDCRLYLFYLKAVSSVDVQFTSVETLFENVRKKELPSFITIVRTRQIVQKENPELCGVQRRKRLGKAERIKEEMAHS